MNAKHRPILERAPGLAGWPIVDLTARPTLIEPLEQISSQAWVKREDQVSPLYGGNKVRRWEWLLGEARARGATHVMTVGGTGSTQVTSLAAHGKALGFSVCAMLFDQPHTPFVDEALALNARFGAEIRVAGGYGKTALATFERWARSRRRGRNTEQLYVIAPGASGPVGTLAYVDCGLEIGEQVQAGLAPRPDRVVVACGSGGTAVGLALGFAMLGWKTVVHAVRITDLIVSNPVTLHAMAQATKRLLRRKGFAGRFSALRIVMEHEFVGQGYGYATPEALRGASQFGALFGAPGEITYSGKALAALDKLVREHPRDTILLVNTLSTTGRSAAEGL